MSLEVVNRKSDGYRIKEINGFNTNIKIINYTDLWMYRVLSANFLIQNRYNGTPVLRPHVVGLNIEVILLVKVSFGPEKSGLNGEMFLIPKWSLGEDPLYIYYVWAVNRNIIKTTEECITPWQFEEFYFRVVFAVTLASVYFNE